MRVINIISALFVCIILINCSSNTSIEDETVTRCFVVKEVNTDITIPYARVYLKEKLEVFDGYYYNTIVMGITDENGEVCLTYNKWIDRIESVADGYSYNHIDNPPLGLIVIYLFPQTSN